MWAGEGQRKRETQKPKQVPGSELYQHRAGCGARTHEREIMTGDEVGCSTDWATWVPQCKVILRFWFAFPWWVMMPYASSWLARSEITWVLFSQKGVTVVSLCRSWIGERCLQQSSAYLTVGGQPQQWKSVFHKDKEKKGLKCHSRNVTLKNSQ